MSNVTSQRDVRTTLRRKVQTAILTVTVINALVAIVVVIWEDVIVVEITAHARAHVVAVIKMVTRATITITTIVVAVDVWCHVAAAVAKTTIITTIRLQRKQQKRKKRRKLKDANATMQRKANVTKTYKSDLIMGLTWRIQYLNWMESNKKLLVAEKKSRFLLFL